MTLPELVIKARNEELPEGHIKGRCMFCGKETESGLEPAFSGNFMGYPYLQDGNCFCPTCYAFFKNQDYRKHSWLVTEKEFKIIHHDDVLDLLLNPPEPPFYIYITIGGQKQGWLNAIHSVNLSNERWWISIEETRYFVKTVELRRQYNIMKMIKERKVAKKELKHRFSISTMLKFDKTGELGILEAANACRGTNEWEVLIYAI